MFINPIGEKHPSEKGEIIQKLAEIGVTKEVFSEHTPARDLLFGVALIDHGDCISARIAMNKQEIEWLVSDEIEDPISYCFLSLDQIKKLDPHTGEALHAQLGVASGF